MSIEVISVDQGIVSISGAGDMGCTQLEELKKQLPENAGLKDLVFFYIPDRDWIVINKGHALYDDYLQVISSYLGLSAEARKESMVQATTDTVKRAFRILDGIIIRRSFIYGEGGQAAYEE